MQPHGVPPHLWPLRPEPPYLPASRLLSASVSWVTGIQSTVYLAGYRRWRAVALSGKAASAGALVAASTDIAALCLCPVYSGKHRADEGAADLVRQHDELPGCAGRGDRAAGRARQLADDRGDLPAGAAAGDHDGGRGHGPDLPAEAAARKLSQRVERMSGLSLHQYASHRRRRDDNQ
jgi:hypothetical protein